MLEDIINKTKKVIVTGLLSLALASCTNNHSSKIDHKKSTKLKIEYDKFVLEHSGNPKVGTIYYIRQAHMPPEKFNKSNNKIINNKESKLIELVSKYQYKILKELIKLNSKDIFNESTIQSNIVFRKKRKNNTKINDLLESPDNICSLKKYLIIEGAAHTYGKFYSKFDSINIHSVYPSLDTALNNHSKVIPQLSKIKLLNGKIILNKKLKYLMFDQRENYAIKEIKKFYSKQKNKGKDVILIYGAYHEFVDDIQRDKEFNPRLYSIIFSELKPLIENNYLN